MRFAAVSFLSVMLLPTVALAAQKHWHPRPRTSLEPPAIFITGPPAAYVIHIKQLDPDIEFPAVICTKYGFNPCLYTSHERLVEVETDEKEKRSLSIHLDLASGIVSVKFISSNRSLLIRANNTEIYEPDLQIGIDLEHPRKIDLELFFERPIRENSEKPFVRLQLMVIPAFSQPHKLTIPKEI